MKINSKLIDKTNFIKNTKNNSTIDTYSCDYSNKTFGGTILWTNPNPTSTFASQTIALSSGDYDILECLYLNDTNQTSKLMQSVKAIKGYSLRLGLASFDGTNTESISRSLSYTNDTQLSASNASNNGTTTNNRMIPYCIIGYKTGLF